MKPYITGYYGCNCHPFSSWPECEAAHKQKLEVGQQVKHRCKGIVGHIEEVCNERGFVIVSGFGMEHVANLEPINE